MHEVCLFSELIVHYITLKKCFQMWSTTAFRLIMGIFHVGEVTHYEMAFEKHDVEFHA
jgi:hypothetical protein